MKHIVMQDIIRARRLTKTFDGVVAVNNIDLSIKKQECFGLLGPNGAGKTTTVLMLYCFLEPTSGSLEVFGDAVEKYARRIKARIGVCPQEYNLDPDLSVWDNLRVFARYFDLTGPGVAERSEELLHFVGLYQKRKSRIDDLSGGMKRRLMLARALLNQPRLLILDEPTTGLDPQARHQIWELIFNLKEKGVTVVLTTHYMEEAAYLCDRLVIMDHGSIIVEGNPGELIEHHVGSNVIEVSAPNKQLEVYLVENGLPYEKTSRYFFIYVKDGGKTFADISKEYCGGQCTLRMANLEDVFLKFTGRELRD